MIALTFDDGPWGTTAGQFLDVLEREHVAATFFEIGEQIATYDPHGAIERRMLADGDMIGDHTWTHPTSPAPRPEQRGRSRADGRRDPRRRRGFTPCLFRPPYGRSARRLIAEARSMGFITIQWNVDPRDWARPGRRRDLRNVVANARNGAIVLQHFGGGHR